MKQSVKEKLKQAGLVSSVKTQQEETAAEAPVVAVQEAEVVQAAPQPTPKALSVLELEALEAAERRQRLRDMDAAEEAEQQARIKKASDSKLPLNPNSPYNADGTRKEEQRNPSIVLPPPTTDELAATVRPALERLSDPLADTLTDKVYREAFGYEAPQTPKKSIALPSKPAKQEDWMSVAPSDTTCEKCGEIRRTDQNFHVLKNGQVCFITE